MLDEAENPVASVLVCDFPDREAIDAWLEADPYRLAGVWHRVEVTRFRVAVERNATRAG